ncbi:hypothetical protein LEP1GSC058_2697 [Leptospira fainei serovar Hurstbridge str. BUT 6]|uniref:Uncharacterized protein n=1 Tax=Leptospira fainei serovar Hurstbridge str. BUT 6 TaxID=1193011 RepID=S3VBY4_9LEPT|nr:hypothetical protein [Leptospira fainei]EPG73980.1 hypothetical protein LEP1GSC058_2697 [Leptospira fainei serovar Hurstbridge str. BUT 6]
MDVEKNILKIALKIQVMEIIFTMKKVILTGIAIICLSSFTNCTQKKKSNDDAAIIALLALTSGNCAQTQKVATNSYFASLSPVPSSSCNQATLFGSDPNSTLTIGKAQLTAVLNIAQGLSGCTNTATAIQNQINSAAPLSQSAWTAFTAPLQWTPITSMVAEGSASISKTWPSLTAAQTGAIGSASVAQYQNFQYESTVSTFAAMASEASCTSAVLAKINADFPTSQFLWSNVTPTAAAPTLITITCSYGSSRNIAFGQCATLNNAY